MRSPVVLIALLLAVPATADVVRLVNGNSFEGVVSEITETQVTIRLTFGEMSLSRESVDRIERRESALGTFLDEWDGLVASEMAVARDWLVLGQRALAEGLDSKAVEAARLAASLDADTEGLDGLFAGLGYVFDEELRRWVPYEEFMRRRDYVLERGEWVSRQVLEARHRERAASDRDRRAEARESRLNRVVEILALAQLQRLEEERSRPPVLAVPYGAFPVASFPGYWNGYRPGYGGGGPVVGPPGPPVHLPAGPASGGHGRGGFSAYAPSSWNDVARRQPGSIIPLQPTAPPPLSSSSGRQ